MNDESSRKKIKRLTGEIDLLESYCQSMSLIFAKAIKPKKDTNLSMEMKKIQKSLAETVFYMRELCEETGLNVPNSKRVQRQVRYERLRNEFINLIDKIKPKRNSRSGSSASN